MCGDAVCRAEAASCASISRGSLPFSSALGQDLDREIRAVALAQAAADAVRGFDDRVVCQNEAVLGADLDADIAALAPLVDPSDVDEVDDRGSAMGRLSGGVGRSRGGISRARTAAAVGRRSLSSTESRVTPQICCLSARGVDPSTAAPTSRRWTRPALRAHKRSLIYVGKNDYVWFHPIAPVGSSRTRAGGSPASEGLLTRRTVLPLAQWRSSW